MAPGVLRREELDEPQILVVLIVIAFFALCLLGGGYLIYRTMTRTDSHIGARFRPPQDDTDSSS